MWRVGHVGCFIVDEEGRVKLVYVDGISSGLTSDVGIGIGYFDIVGTSSQCCDRVLVDGTCSGDILRIIDISRGSRSTSDDIVIVIDGT